MSEAIETPASGEGGAAASVLGGEGGGSEVQVTEAASWRDGLDSDTIGLIESRKWDGEGKNPLQEVAKAYRNMERLRGVNADRLVRLPDEGNEAQTLEMLHKLGVPGDPSGYESPEVMIGDQPIDGALIAEHISHKIAATPEQHRKLVEATGALLASSQEAQAEQAAQAEAERVEHMSTHAKQWEKDQGADLEANRVLSRRGLEALGLDTDAIDKIALALSDDGSAIKQLLDAGMKFGKFVGESSRGDDGRAPDTGGFAASSAEAKYEAELYQAQNFEALKKPDAAGEMARRELQRRWDRFHDLSAKGR